MSRKDTAGVQVVTTTPDELQRLIEQAVETALAKNLTPEGWMDTEACAAYIASTPNSVRDLVRRSGLPHHRAPGSSRLLFKPSEIDEWIAGQS